MDELPQELNEQHLRELQEQWDEQQQEKYRDQSREWRKKFAADFLSLKGDERHLMITFPLHMDVECRRRLLNEVRERFPTKQIIPQLPASLAERYGKRTSAKWDYEVTAAAFSYKLKLRE